MLLKTTIKCICGCSYELISKTPHNSVVCPNCNHEFTESEKLINILKLFNSLDLDSSSDECDVYSNIFNKESITIETIDGLDESNYK